MRWEWDESGDSRVAELWHLREQLSRSKKAVYVKWYRNRATLLSPECFQWARAVLRAQPGFLNLSSDAKRVLAIIADNSPISTKALKKQAKVQFSMPGPAVEKSMTELWKRLLIVGFGEVDDGAFPSLAVGGAEQIFESWCHKSDSLGAEQCHQKLRKKLGKENLFVLELEKICKSMQALKIPKAASAKTRSGARVVRYEDLVGR
jgi:hypothetical protein